MTMHLKRAAAPVAWRRGCKRGIRPDRARDEDLHFFLRMSKASRRAMAREIDELIRPA
jgi:hypothetical protein